jgi:hypothetical protein
VVTYGIVTEKGGLYVKDYTKDYDETKRFIKEYDIVDNEIVIRLASGEKYIIPYNEINEKKVLEKMEDQAKNLRNVENRFEKHFRCSASGIAFTTLCIGLVIIFLKNPLFTIGQMSWIVGSASLLDIAFVGACIDSKVRLNDARKSRIFIGNKDSLNKHLSSHNKNVLLGVSKDLCTKIDNKLTTSEKPVFDINFIGKEVTLGDLEIIKDNIERYREFGFIEESNPKNTEDKGNARTYKSK